VAAKGETAEGAAALACVWELEPAQEDNMARIESSPFVLHALAASCQALRSDEEPAVSRVRDSKCSSPARENFLLASDLDRAVFRECRLVVPYRLRFVFMMLCCPVSLLE
jgi:hypothetical protein